MPENLDENMIKAALAAVEAAQRVRKFHARRTSKTSKQRRTDIEVALGRLKEVMAPLKSEIGRFAYGPQTATAEANRQRIREVSAAVQRERRKLWKMRPKPKAPA